MMITLCCKWSLISCVLLCCIACNESKIGESNVLRGLRWLQRSSLPSLAVATSLLSTYPNMVHASDTSNTQSLVRLKTGLKDLNNLLEHFEEKTIFCNFGEFDRTLLSPEKKDELLVAAAKGSLLDYDKSDTMIVMCRKDPEMVRAYLGLGEGRGNALYQAESVLRSPATLQLLDPDNLDTYIDDVEHYVEAVAEVETLTYEARRDYRSTETFSRQDLMTSTKLNEAQNTPKNDYLTQSKGSVMKARDALQGIIQTLGI